MRLVISVDVDDDDLRAIDNYEYVRYGTRHSPHNKAGAPKAKRFLLDAARNGLARAHDEMGDGQDTED